MPIAFRRNTMRCRYRCDALAKRCDAERCDPDTVPMRGDAVPIAMRYDRDTDAMRSNAMPMSHPRDAMRCRCDAIRSRCRCDAGRSDTDTAPTRCVAASITVRNDRDTDATRSEAVPLYHKSDTVWCRCDAIRSRYRCDSERSDTDAVPMRYDAVPMRYDAIVLPMRCGAMRYRCDKIRYRCDAI